MNTPIPYGKQHITEDDLKAVTETLLSDFLTQGPKIAEFEKAFAEYVGAKYAVALSNGTAALHLCAMALDVNEQTNVITTPITFAASANCIRYCGGHVFFADINPNNFTLDIDAVEKLIASKPSGFFKGIIPVDFAGYAVDLEAYRKLADKHGLWIIEDACHAPGGYFIDSNGNQQRCGNSQFADMAIFSFHPVKHIACGEGGMITTNNEALYKKLLFLRTHGITKDPQLLEQNDGGWYYEMQTLGYNYRLTDFQAALGISQLKRADDGLARRREIAARYEAAFNNKAYVLNQSGSVSGHAYHLYIIRTEQRKALYDFLRTKNIFCQVHYIPVHTMPYYKGLGHQKGDYPLAEKYYDECLSLPMYPTLTNEEQDFVIRSIHEFFNN
ncbi:MAG: UDP-4-amino-4,6-dideoxy-N-acetyl-beta-L-altrosamine transaminase [Bacteroidetes bacterium]|nr:MAG: UDP-4-amino-4,6-dideoxy-N-acetyl-beta-L-altrosamine transaminase [Bacteroidota bacterium]